jgi:two-component system, NarL family, nitrate/nitrite response regulator NarL
MAMGKSLGVSVAPRSRDILVVSQLRFLSEMLVELFGRTSPMRVCGTAATLDEALGSVQANAPAIVLLDTAFPGGAQTAERIIVAAPHAFLIALGLCEKDIDVIAWAEAGIAGYVPNTASVDDLISCIEGITYGEQVCSAKAAACLLRYVARARHAPPGVLSGSLTHREREVLQLLGAGLSNKDIARRLAISVGTTKSHVHNLLGKLNLSRRVEVIRSQSNGL